MIRIAFLGTPAVAVPGLLAFVEDDDVEVAAVVTNPDRPRGRSRTPKPPPVKEAAVEHDLTVLQPEAPAAIVDDLAALELDAGAIVAYGAILPPAVLDTAEHGFVNLHFSLLPRWRGAAPVQHAIMAGDDVSGVTTFVLDEGMDTGPVIDRVEVAIEPDETAGDVLDRLATLGAPVLLDSVKRLVAGSATPTPQSDTGASIAPKIDSDDVRIDFGADAVDVVNLIRAANPSPGAHTTYAGDRFKIWRAEPADGEGTPGEILSSDGDGPVVAAGTGAVRLREVQPAGKARMDARSWANGYQPEPGERLGA